jgi:ribosomal protein L35
MPKIKTHRATSKRIRLSGGRKRKFMQRHATQGHFNAREDGETVRLKRRDREVDSTHVKRLKKLLAYSQNRNYTR